MDANFFENTQDLIHDHHVRLWTVPVEGEDTREVRNGIYCPLRDSLYESKDGKGRD